MIINDLFTNKKTKVSEGMAGKVVFRGTGADGGTYEIIQSSATDFMIHANGNHIDTYGSLQRAMSVLKNEVPGLQQGMAEGLWDQHTSIPELEQAIKNLIMGYKGGVNLTDKGRAQLLLSINKGKRILAKKKQQQGVAEASDQSNAISQEQLNQMYANAKPMMFIKNTPVALVPLAKINQIGTPQQVQQVQQALGSVDQTSYTDEYKNKGYVVFQWNGTALDLYVASPEVVSQKYVRFNGQLPQDQKSRGKIPSLIALSKLGIDPSKVPFFVKKVPNEMVSAKQLGLEGKTIQVFWGSDPSTQEVAPGGFLTKNEHGMIYTIAPDAQGLPIGYLPAQQGVAEAQTDYQKRRQRERDVDAGKPVKPLPKNPQNDYFARRKKEQGMSEGSGPVTHRIGLTVTDPNHPMVSKRKEPYQKSVRITQDVPDREAAINQAIAHHRRKGYKVHDHHYIGTVDDEPVNELDKKTVASWVRQQPQRIKGDTGLSRTNFKKAKRLVDKSIPSALSKIKDPGYGQQEPRLDEVSLGDYPKKAAVSQAGAKIKKFFGRDDPAAVAAADRTIANRTKGLARADARRKPYTVPPAAPVDLEKQQRDLTAKYPNIDELVRRAELNRDPNYERADGQAYYTARDAEQNYLKLKQIQRVIQGLNESLQRLDEFNPFSKKKVDTTSPTTEPQAAGGMKFDLMGRPYKPAPVTPNYDKSVADYSNTTMNAPAASVPNTKSMMPTNMMPSTATAPVAKPVGTATPTNPYQVTTARTTTTPAAAPKTAMTTTAPELQTIDAPAQLTGPAQAKQLGMANPDITDVVARAPTAKKAPASNLAALPAPAAPTTPNYGSGVTNATMNAPTASVPNTKSMQPKNMMPRTATASTTSTAPTLTPTEKKEIYQYLTKTMKFGSKEAKDAIKNLPPGIGIKDAVKQIFRNSLGKSVTSESLTWSQNFNPGRSLYRRMKQDR